MRGIDISQFQENVNFNKVKKSGIEFVIIRAGFGRYEIQRDPYLRKTTRRPKRRGFTLVRTGILMPSLLMTPSRKPKFV